MGTQWCLEVKRMDNPALSSVRQEDFSDFIGEVAGGIASGERMPLLVYRVYVADGHEELVRGGHYSRACSCALCATSSAIGDDATVFTYMQTPAERIRRNGAGRVRLSAGRHSQHGDRPSLLLDEIEIRGFHGEPRRLPLVALRR